MRFATGASARTTMCRPFKGNPLRPGLMLTRLSHEAGVNDARPRHAQRQRSCGAFGHATCVDFAANVSRAGHGRAQVTLAKEVRNFAKAPSTAGRNAMLPRSIQAAQPIMGGPTLTLRVDLGSGRALGPGKIRLLEAIAETGSISKAGRK